MLPPSASPHMQIQRRHIRHSVEAALLVRGIGSSPAHAHRGQVVTMELNLPGTGEPVVLSARVCHRSDTRCGFEFLAPSAEAVNLLRQLFPKS
jgi:hypothetical protein